MRRPVPLPVIGLLLCMLACCNQPFEPDGPVSNHLVLYAILASESDTQYVRLSTTYGTTGAPEVTDAVVEMVAEGRVIGFRDTTVAWIDLDGRVSPMNVYVAYGVKVKEGVQYDLRASTPSGLTASARVTALNPPVFSLRTTNTAGHFTLDIQFKSTSGAFVMHFYFYYYALIDGGWELRKEEVPIRTYEDEEGNGVLVYPELAVVRTLGSGLSSVQIQYDSTLYEQARSRIYEKYPSAPVVYVQNVFVLTQIDDILYSYFYLNNGPVDQSTIRLDRPDYTNIQQGYGVFGSRSEVTRRYTLLK